MNLSETHQQAHSSPLSSHSTTGGFRVSGATPIGDATLPLVSVITAVFNGDPYLEKCLDSVANQDYSNIEHIVIDGGSSDGTLDILKTNSERITFWKSERDNGIYDAWNKGLAESRGDWICFLGADDEFLPGAISTYMVLAALNPEAEFLSSRIRVVYPSGYVKTVGEPWHWQKFSRFMCAVHTGSMHRRTLFERNGVFDTSYRSAGDYEFLLRARGDLKAAFTREVTVIMHAGGASTTSQALREKARAKVVTGGRSKFLTSIEHLLDMTQYAARPLLYFLRGIAVRFRRKRER